MKIEFPHYEAICQDSTLATNNKEIIRSLMCEKLIQMNNNKKMTREYIEKNLTFDVNKVRLFNNKELCAVEYLFQLETVTMRLTVYINFNREGIYRDWNAQYLGSSVNNKLMNLLNINHFEDSYSRLDFSLSTYKGDETNYQIIKEYDIKIAESPLNKNIVKYSFNKNHVMFLRGFEYKNANYSTNYSFAGYEKFETELMLLKFVKHVTKEREHVDPSFFNHTNFDFSKQDWFEKVEKVFFRNLTGDKRTAFLDYMKLIDMIEI